MTTQARAVAIGAGRLPAVVATALVGVVFGAIVLVVADTGRTSTTTTTLFSATVGGLYLATGVFAYAREPGPIGRLMVMTGIGWFAEDLQVSIDPLWHTAGLFVRTVVSGLLVHLLLSFPEGRIRARPVRALVVVSYLLVTVVVPLGVPFYRSLKPNLLLVSDLTDVQVLVLAVVQVVVSVLVVAVLARRWQVASWPARRVLAPVYGVGLVGGVASLIRPVLPEAAAMPVNDVAHLATIALPLAFLAGVLRVRLSRTAVADLLTRLSLAPPAAQLRDLIARALGDVSLRIAYPLPDDSGLVDGHGRPVAVSASETATEVRRGGRLVAVLLHDPAVGTDKHVLNAVTAAAALELDNQRLAAEVRAQLAEVRASRARVVAAGDEERRRLERDLHDGVQQHLVTAALILRMARDSVNEPATTGTLLARAADGLDTACAQLRELARGIHPAVLTESGLRAALNSIAERAALPVEIDATDLPDLPAQVASTAYFVAAEVVTNAAKHAAATFVHILVRCSDTHLSLELVDDGRGGANPKGGTGLVGLHDRVGAVDGRMTVESPAGGGTSVRVDLPLDLPLELT